MAEKKISCNEIRLEVLAEREFPIKGEVRYHSLPSINRETSPIIDLDNARLKVELLKNPGFNYRETNEKMKMIYLSLPYQLYDGSITARGGDDMTSHYETFCQMIQEGKYILHLFSNARIEIDER